MKATIIPLLALATALVSATPTKAAETCSNASLRGTYGFHGFATVVSPGSPGTPRAIIGVFTLDGRGTWNASLTVNDNGIVTKLPPATQPGTYLVNPDCTGTLFPSTGGSIEIVVVDGGREFYQMRTAPASVVLYGTTKKVSPDDK